MDKPTDAQLAALREYAAAHGRYWKAQLRDDWEHSRIPGEIQQLRNSFGPRWLIQFRLNKGK